MRARISSRPAVSRLTMRTSLMEPVTPPSELAPLSETRTTIVLSASPLASRCVSSRPIWSSVCDRNPAKHSMKRAATFWSSGSRSLDAGSHDPELHLPGDDALAQRVPPVVEQPAVALNPLRRRVVRGVTRTGGEVQEERLLTVGVAQVAQVLDGVIDEILGEVVTLGGRARRLHGVVVAVERRDELMRLAAVEAVPAVEAAPDRPAAAVGGHVGLVVGREVPLAHCVG